VVYLQFFSSSAFLCVALGLSSAVSYQTFGITAEGAPRISQSTAQEIELGALNYEKDLPVQYKSHYKLLIPDGFARIVVNRKGLRNG